MRSFPSRFTKNGLSIIKKKGKTAAPKPLASVKLNGNTFAASAIQALAASFKEIDSLTVSRLPSFV